MPDSISSSLSSNTPASSNTTAALTGSGLSSDTSALVANHISKTVSGPNGDLTILSDASVTVETAEAIAIVGPSGSGKSTLLGLLAGLDSPTGGDVELLGQSLKGLDEDARARLRAGRVGFVFQSFQLLPGLSALENVMLPLELAGLDDARGPALEMLGQVGLADRAKHHPLQLSGGEQQRVAVARAFVSTPALLFADEPTGNLDGETGAVIIDLMFSLREQQQSALVLVTHDTALAQRCDRRYKMVSGVLSPESDASHPGGTA